jgi:hypothetical protein
MKAERKDNAKPQAVTNLATDSKQTNSQALMNAISLIGYDAEETLASVSGEAANGYDFLVEEVREGKSVSA